MYCKGEEFMNGEQGFNEMNMNQRLNNFKDQIERDIKDIQEEYANIDSRIRDVDYAFLYWILLKLFNIDEEETITDYITEGNDKSVDCFVCFEDIIFILKLVFWMGVSVGEKGPR